MKRVGFTIIELLIATSIAGMMSVVLFMTLFQVNTGVRITVDMVTVESDISQVQYQLERDLSGATTLIEDVKPEDKKPTPAQAQPGAPKPAEPKEEPAKDEKKVKKIEKVFYSTRDGDRLGTLTFITNNPLPKFIDEKDIRLVRMAYRLQEDKNRRGTFALMRQESTSLDYEKFSSQNVRAYALVDGIKDFSVKFLAKIEEEQEPDKNGDATAAPGQPAAPKPTQAKKEKKVSYKEVGSWDTDALAKEQKDKKKGPQQKPIPARVDIQGSFWDITKKRSTPFHFKIAIITDTELKPRPKPPAPPKTTPPKTTPLSPGQQQPTPLQQIFGRMGQRQSGPQPPQLGQ